VTDKPPLSHGELYDIDVDVVRHASVGLPVELRSVTDAIIEHYSDGSSARYDLALNRLDCQYDGDIYTSTTESDPVADLSTVITDPRRIAVLMLQRANAKSFTIRNSHITRRCLYGHSVTLSNSYISRNPVTGKLTRQCRTCQLTRWSHRNRRKGSPV
jgi:hypothetical protein